MKKQPISAYLQCQSANQSKLANTTAKATTPSHLRVTPNQLSVKKLEELGIGRPSTFASIIQTIQDRGYVYKRGRALVPTFLAFSVTGLLETHFTKLVDYDFTASMEEDLDKIAAGEAGRVDWLRDFYYGHDGQPGLDELTLDLGSIDARATNTMIYLTPSKSALVATVLICKKTCQAKIANSQTFLKNLPQMS